MSEQHNRRAARLPSQIVFQPFKLICAQFTHPIYRSNIYQPDEVDTLLIEAVPTSATRAFTVASEILFSVVDRNIVLAGHIEDLLLPGCLEYPFHGVEFGSLRRMTDIASVNDELRWMWKRVDLVHRCLERRGNIRIRGFVESNMAVADLNEIHFAFGAACGVLTESLRAEHSAADRPDDSGAGPCHAFQESASIDAIVVVVVNDES